MRLSVPGHKDLRKIVVLNPKGGCGKSTLATNLAGYLAKQGNSVAIMDFDPQGSSMRWLKVRPGNSAPIHGISAFDLRSSATRSWQLRVPSSVRYLIVDSPASVPAENLAELTSGAHAILIPVLPSDIDVHAASLLMKDLLLIAKVSRRMGRIGVIANRVRENTVAYRKLMRFLQSLSISVVGVLKDSQNYVHSAERGLSITRDHSFVKQGNQRAGIAIGSKCSVDAIHLKKTAPVSSIQAPRHPLCGMRLSAYSPSTWQWSWDRPHRVPA